MDWSTIQDGWSGYKRDAKQEWDKLSDEQLSATNGQRMYLSMRLQEAYSVNASEAERQIAAWQAKQMAKPDPAANS